MRHLLALVCLLPALLSASACAQNTPLEPTPGGKGSYLLRQDVQDFMSDVRCPR
jgi:hypothetical protein